MARLAAPRATPPWSRVHLWPALATLGGCFLLAWFLLAAWTTYLSPPALRYTNIPFPVVGNGAHAGQPLILLVGRWNDTERPVLLHASRNLVTPEGRLIAIADSTGFAPPGCQLVESQLTVLPSDLAPGSYRMVGAIETTNVWGRVSLIDFSSQSFIVAPG